MKGLCDKHGWYRPTGRQPWCPGCYRERDLRAVAHEHNCIPSRDWLGRAGWRCVRCHRWFRTDVRMTDWSGVAP